MLGVVRFAGSLLRCSIENECLSHLSISSSSASNCGTLRWIAVTRHPCLLNPTRSQSTIPEHVMVFDRETKRRQRNWAATSEHYDVCQYVKDEIGYRVADKIFDLTKYNEVCIDLGCGGGHIAPNIIKENVGVLIQCDMSEGLVRRSKSASDSEVPTLRIIADEELVPFRDQCADLIVSSLSAHWINKLPQWFARCYSILRPDAAMIGAVLAGETLYELRVSLQLAESERLGGIGAHISPFIKPQDIGGLMNRAGFDMITLDTDEIEVGYPNMFALLYDLQCMSESNATNNRSPHLRREVLIAADSIYRAMFGRENGAYPATFQVISFIGWRPGPLMPKPAKRGSQNVSFKDLSKIIEGKQPLPTSEK
uniref:Arginine-hydroxylase NDUFAF5, mitochondrial n=1 Tax=Ascaris suum TaxID=6253 RepID=F1L6Q7_ASCSU